jgi:hypothetical protein
MSNNVNPVTVVGSKKKYYIIYVMQSHEFKVIVDNAPIGLNSATFFVVLQGGPASPGSINILLSSREDVPIWQ